MNEVRDEPPGRLRDSSRRELALLALLALIYFLTNTDSLIVPPLLTSVEAGFGGKVDGWLLVPAYGLATAITSLTLGAWVDRRGCGAVMPVALSMFGAGLACTSLSPIFGGLIAARALTGIGSALLSLTMMIRINEVFGSERRHAAFGIFVTGGVGAAVLGLPAGALLERQFGWRAPFALVLTLAAATLAVLLVLDPGHKRLNPRKREIREKRVSIVAFLRGLGRDRRQLWVLSLGLIFNGGSYAMMNVLGLWCRDRFGLPTSEIFRYYIFGGIAGILASPLAGRVSSRIGVIPTIVVGDLALAVAYALAPFSPSPGFLFPVFVAASAFGLFRIVPYHVLTLEVSGEDRRAQFVGLRNAISQFGIFAGGAIGGLIYDKTSWGYAGVGIFAGITCLAAIPILVHVGRTR